MEEKVEIVGVHILRTRCGKCQHISYAKFGRCFYMCMKRSIMLPTLAKKTFACECRSFKPYRYRITVECPVLWK